MFSMINKNIIGVILILVLLTLVFPISATSIQHDDLQEVQGTTPLTYPEENSPPLPPVISGPTTGRTGVYYDYQFLLLDYDEDDFITILEVDFGNEIKQAIKKNCEKPWYNGTDIWMSHQWDQNGEYMIKARTMDSYGAWSDWSDPLSVSLPKQKSFVSHFTFLSERFPFLSSFFAILAE